MNIYNIRLIQAYELVTLVNNGDLFADGNNVIVKFGKNLRLYRNRKFISTEDSVYSAAYPIIVCDTDTVKQDRIRIGGADLLFPEDGKMYLVTDSAYSVGSLDVEKMLSDAKRKLEDFSK